MTDPFNRLTTELGWPLLADLPAFEAFVSAPGTHAVLALGERDRNLESADVAVILPELVLTFQRRFDAALAGPVVDEAARARAGSYQTPNILFFRDGAFLGDIPKVRDWNDYMARIAHILGRRPASGAPRTEDAA